MCGNTSCIRALTDRVKLRRLCIELAGAKGGDLRDFTIDAAHLIFDVCEALTIEPLVVMDARTVCAIRAEGSTSLWPTLTEAEVTGLAETDAIREGPAGRDTGMREGASYPDDTGWGEFWHWSKLT